MEEVCNKSSKGGFVSHSHNILNKMLSTSPEKSIDTFSFFKKGVCFKYELATGN